MELNSRVAKVKAKKMTHLNLALIMRGQVARCMTRSGLKNLGKQMSARMRCVYAVKISKNLTKILKTRLSILRRVSKHATLKFCALANFTKVVKTTKS